MTAAIPVSLPLNDSFSLPAYQVANGGQEWLLFTHRQIAEAIGRTKSTVQRYLKQHGEGLPSPVTVKIPHRPHPVPLTPLTAALAYWQSQAEAGNETAAALLAALNERPLTDISVVGEEREAEGSEGALTDKDTPLSWLALSRRSRCCCRGDRDGGSLDGRGGSRASGGGGLEAEPTSISDAGLGSSSRVSTKFSLEGGEELRRSGAGDFSRGLAGLSDSLEGVCVSGIGRVF